MSDKGFGDNSNRNIVKNPLLSTAVTGLSLEDLTHNAVLLPVAQSQELITRQDQQPGFQNIALVQPEPSSPDLRPPPPPDHAAPKTEDDFDVNEYFARLQGTRYVSAPLNSSLKEDPTSAEENLEEINLNEPDKSSEVQQSITADIAQNFSQLPTVLPQVASAVFSSFSNMLSYKSREVTPDERAFPRPEERVEEVGVPLMGMDEPLVPREVAPPPREVPSGGTTSFRITTKKKAYAQIPGLSSQIPPQHLGNPQMAHNPPPMGVPQHGGAPAYFIPDSSTNPPQPPMDPKPPMEPKHDHTEPNTFFERKPEPIMPTVPNFPQEPVNVPTNPTQGGPPIIPPPPMFSNVPRKDSSASVEKSVLPPSVARRIGANHPIIKPQTQAPTFSADNIFVPTPISDNATQNTATAVPVGAEIPTDNPKPESSSQDLPTQNLPSAFVQFKSTYSTISNMHAHNPHNIAMPVDPYTGVPVFPTSEGRKITPPSAVRMPSPNEASPYYNPDRRLSASLLAVNATRNKSVESAIASNTAIISQRPDVPTFFNPANMPAHGHHQPVSPPGHSDPQFGAHHHPQPHHHMLPHRHFPSHHMPQSHHHHHMPQQHRHVPQPHHHMPPPPFFNPSTIQPNPPNTDTKTDPPAAPPQNIVGQPVQTPAAEEAKPVPEPPKLTGGLNYRMTKKRPQYYSGPIEGIGAISNNVKPVIPGAETRAFQGALFTPDQQADQQTLSDPAAPFDISKPAEMTSSYTPFEINSQINNQAQSYVSPDYNTAFDLSRPSDNYDEVPKQSENKGFGIIGSLKSKLSSIDINKIQNSVTTFFDPAYNDIKKEPTDTQGSAPYGFNQTGGAFGYTNQESNLEIFVPNVEHQANNQSYNSDKQYHNIYSSPSHYGTSDDIHYYGACPSKRHGAHFDYSQGTFARHQQSTFPDVPPPSSGHFDHNHPFHHSNNPNTPQTQPGNNAENTTQAPGNNQNNKHEMKEDQNTQRNNLASELTDLTNAPVVDSNFNTYNLFSQAHDSANVIRATLDNMNMSQRDGFKKDGLSNIIRLEPASAMSFFDNPGTEINDNMTDHLGNLMISNVRREQVLERQSFPVPDNRDLSPDFSVDIIQPLISTAPGEIRNTSDMFGTTECESKTADFVQSAIGCAFIKKENVEDIHKDVDVSKMADNFVDLSIKQGLKDNIPTIDMSSVPLFGLSSMLAEKTKEISDFEESMQSVTLHAEDKESKTRLDSDVSAGLFETLNTTAQHLTDEENDGISELNICETCREIDKPEDKDVDDLTVKLIENITSPIQLSNPVVAPFLTETNTPVDDRADFDSKQCAEISHITEETIETIQVQSATELLDDAEENATTNARMYGWAPEETNNFTNSEVLIDHNYTFQIDPSAIGFFGNNAMFFENIPNNASDEIKAEFQSSQEDTPVVSQRQMSVPTAPPAEDDDSKSDETGGLDVHSIEQDAKKDFPLYEEFVVEPSETDDDKIEYREREKSSEDPAQEEDSFTNRVEKFKKLEETLDKHDEVFEAPKAVFDVTSATSPAITIASYFDTGNYAVESHYKNSLSSPSSIPFPIASPDVPMRIPPGFEDEYKRRLSGILGQDATDKDSDTEIKIPYVPETSTQTRMITTTTYSQISNLSSPINTIEAKQEDKPTEAKLPEFMSVFGRNHDSGDALSSSIFNPVEDKKETTASVISPPAVIEAQKPLPDPISFFSTGQEAATETPDSGFNRLASYFQTPAKNDHGKSFFELSQSQNHYRHALASDANSNQIAQSSVVKQFFDSNANQNVNSKIENIPDDVYVANLQLMKDLTSIQNISFPTEQNVRTVNYFTVEYDNEDIKTALKTDFKTEVLLKDSNPKNVDTTENIDDDKAISVIVKCKFCRNFDSVHIVTLNKVELDSVEYKLKKTMDNADGEASKYAGRNAESPKDEKRREVAVSFGPLDEDNEGIALATENRTTSEYSPVKHHWFYRVDFEGKSIWRGFSASDSRALEDAFHSPDLTEETLVPTDGGRFDVNVVGRLRIAVYWTAKPTNVRRCSWFYKGATDARYVPYTESVAEKLEEEYRHGVTTGEWHRRLVLPNNESVVMHGPGVMVHFPQPASDALSAAPSVVMHGPGVMVHFPQPASDALSAAPQSTMRPRVVRRGTDETEIEDQEPSSIDHLLLLCHGVGSACDMRFRSVEEVVDDFRSTSLQLLQSHYRNAYDKGVVNRVEVLPISWHATLHSGETGVDKRLAAITLDSIPKLRNFTNDTVLDVLFYTSPVFCQTILDTVCAELNRIYGLFTRRNPSFAGSVSLGGHSLGSVILYDLLCHQSNEAPNIVSGSPSKSFVTGVAGTGQASVRYPSLDFQPATLYALGSPIAMFECIRGVKALGADFSLPTCKNFFNIFHPYDPIAYRIEPLINAKLGEVKPFLIPHHKGRKRMHLELKDTMARVGADLKQKLLESLRATWTSMWKQPPASDAHLEKVVEEEMEKEQLCEENKDEAVQNDLELGEALGRLNGGRRVDYVLQEAPFEMINEYLFAMSSHVCYWESEDTMLLILREIYDALGVPPDCTVPQQSMTVQRHAEPHETIIMSASECPSTSRGGT